MTVNFRSAIEENLNERQPKWHRRRTMEDIQYLVIHQTGGHRRDTFRKGQIDHQTITKGAGLAYALRGSYNFGLPTFAYHFWIGGDGEIVQANAMTSETTTVRGYNKSVLSVVFSGSFAPATRDEKLSSEQKDAFRWLIPRLMKKLGFSSLPSGGHRRLVGHCELDAARRAACPGTEAMELIDEYYQRRIEFAASIEQAKRAREIQKTKNKEKKSDNQVLAELQKGFGEWLVVNGVTVDQVLTLGSEGVGLVKGAGVEIIIDPTTGKPYINLSSNTSEFTPPQDCQTKKIGQAI